jgi:hypothetical protein
MRAAVSVELPAAKGTTTVTGRVGQPCADAGAAAAAIETVPSTNSASRNRFRTFSPSTNETS